MKSEEYRVDALVIILASMTTILFLIISFVFPELQILLLTILTILLPVIYQIGNMYSKESIRKQNQEDLEIIEEVLEDLEDENERLRRKITQNGK